ncbi:MAG: hypothetical protein U0451_02395 [Candidatus Saccharimonadales bacterium]
MVNNQFIEAQTEFGKLLTPAKLSTFSSTSLFRLIEINDEYNPKFLPEDVVAHAQQKPEPDDLPIAQALRKAEDFHLGQTVMLKSINMGLFTSNEVVDVSDNKIGLRPSGSRLLINYVSVEFPGLLSEADLEYYQQESKHDSGKKQTVGWLNNAISRLISKYNILGQHFTDDEFRIIYRHIQWLRQQRHST